MAAPFCAPRQEWQGWLLAPEMTLILNGQQHWAHRSLTGQECVSWHLSWTIKQQQAGAARLPHLPVPTLDAPLGTEAPEPSAMQ